MQNGQSVFLVSLPKSRSLFSASFQTSRVAYLNTQKYGLFCSLLLDCCYILLGQPVDGSHCCEDGLRLFSKNTVLCVAERIPHSFFINSILMFFSVFMSLQS